MSAPLLQLDPFAAVSDERYEDEYVTVSPGRTPGVTAQLLDDGRVAVRHRLALLDDDLAEELAVALTSLTGEFEVFARAFTGIVLTSDADPLAAWERFYRNSLRPHRGGYAEIYRHALALLPRTSVLDLGCGFGFLALHLAALGADVRAHDLDPGSLRLLAAMSGRLDASVRVAREPADAVALLHVLEHADDPEAVLAEALGLARRRVVVAVPFEERPTSLFGHVRRYDAAGLRALGAAAAQSGWSFDVHEHHGGWLVLDHPSG